MRAGGSLGQARIRQSGEAPGSASFAIFGYAVRATAVNPRTITPRMRFSR